MSKSHSRRAILVGIAAAPALAGPPLALSGPDPILALIEQHRVAWAVSERAQSDEEINAASDLRQPIEQALAITRPTTLAGVLAIMRYERELSDQPEDTYYDLFDFEGRHEDGPPRITIRTWLTTIEQSIAAIAAGEVVSFGVVS
jgi:hypothetical protein